MVSLALGTAPMCAWSPEIEVSGALHRGAHTGPRPSRALPVPRCGRGHELRSSCQISVSAFACYAPMS